MTGLVCGDCRAANPGALFDAGLQRVLGRLTDPDSAAGARWKISQAQSRQLLELLLDLAQHHLEIRLNSRAFLADIIEQKGR